MWTASVREFNHFSGGEFRQVKHDEVGSGAIDDRGQILTRELWATTFPFDEARVTETVTKSVHRSYRPDGLLRQLVAAMGTPGLWEAQRSIAQTMLVVHGSDDSDFAPDHPTGIAQQAQNVDLWLVEGIGHSMPPKIWGRHCAENFGPR